MTVEIPVLKRLLRSFEVRMKLKELISGEHGATDDVDETAAAKGCEIALAKGCGDVVVSGLSYDSRTTRPRVSDTRPGL